MAWYLTGSQNSRRPKTPLECLSTEKYLEQSIPQILQAVRLTKPPLQNGDMCTTKWWHVKLQHLLNVIPKTCTCCFTAVIGLPLNVPYRMEIANTRGIRFISITCLHSCSGLAALNNLFYQGRVGDYIGQILGGYFTTRRLNSDICVCANSIYSLYCKVQSRSTTTDPK